MRVYLFARSRTGTLPHLVRVGRPVGGPIVASARGVSARLRCAHYGRVDARSTTLLDTNIILRSASANEPIRMLPAGVLVRRTSTDRFGWFSPPARSVAPALRQRESSDP